VQRKIIAELPDFHRDRGPDSVAVGIYPEYVELPDLSWYFVKAEIQVREKPPLNFLLNVF